MDDIREKIIKACRKAPSNDELFHYLKKLIDGLSPTKFEESLKTLKEAINEYLKDDKTGYTLQLKNQSCLDLSESFFLTPGLHIIAGPSGSGKTLWAMEWAKEAAKNNESVLVLSLEMTHRDLACRTISQIGDFSLKSLSLNQISELEKLSIENYFEDQPWSKNILIDEIGDYDYSKIQARLWDRMIKYRPNLVIVDYAQMIYTSDPDKTNAQALSDIARDLKLFSEHNQSAVLLLSQFNRESLKHIRRSDLDKLGFVPLSNEFVKESGGIVEAADSTQMVCIPERIPDCPENLKNCFQVTVDKSRKIGILGTWMIDFDTVKMKFK